MPAVNRTARATVAAAFTYVYIGASIVSGLWLIPFTLRILGTQLYGLWLASGELIAYAGFTEMGVLVTLPWLIAEADGRGDRERMRHLVSTGVAASAVTGIAAGIVAFALWVAFPVILRVGAADQRMLRGPLLVLAFAACVVNPLRAFGAVTTALQDVRFNGAVAFVEWLLGFVLCVVMLLRGWGLYALAISTVLPALLSRAWTLLRVWIIAPDLLRGWSRPSWRDVQRLFAEGVGMWFAGWGWKLISASDSLVLGILGRPTAVAALACTSKMEQALVNLSWVPCDSGLVGLAQLSGEGRRERLRDALVVMIRVYLALAGGVACVVLAVNPAFVRVWVGPNLYAGGLANGLIAILAITTTFGHAIAVVPSVLGERMRIGVATLVSGLIHLGLAVALGLRFGIAGVVLAGIISHGVVFCALAWKSFARATGTTELALAADVVRPWAWRIAPLLLLAFLAGRVIAAPPLVITIPAGAAIGGLVMLVMRPLYLEFGPVRHLYDRVMRWPRRLRQDVQPL